MNTDGMFIAPIRVVPTAADLPVGGYLYTQKFTYSFREGVKAGPLVPVQPRPTWLRGFTYHDLCQRLAEGHHDE